MRRNSMPVLCMIMTLVLLFSSCSHGFLKDPRLYNPKKNNKQASQDVAAEPDLGLTGGIDAFDKTEEWYNNPQSNGDETNKEAVGFDASEFDTIQITGWFSNKNVPTYTMTRKDVWSAGDQAKGEYIHSNAPNTEGQGWSITGVTYYQYRGLNPSYAPDGNYNTALQVTGKGNPKLNRFYFYRFTGKGGGIQWLDNNLIAVDTYSKLVFAFSEPVEFSSMGAPTKWSPTDKDPFFGQMYQFYMYDPVGYVLKNDDGSYDIKLYQWFQDSLASGNYKANINTAYTKIAEKKPDGAGKSPFNNHSVDFFTENMKLLAGTTFYRREVTPEGLDGLVLYRYTFSEDGKTITRTAESWNGLSTSTDLDEVTYSITEGESATKGKVTGGCNGTLELVDEGRTLKFSNGEVAVSNFTDPGPAFIERVKHNPTYELGKTKYVFSNNGKTLKMGYVNWLGQDETATYTYQKQESNSQARYGGYLVQLYNRDNDIRCSTVANVAVWSSVMEYPAHLKIEFGKTFTETVKRIPFSVRDDDNGLYNDTLHSIEFSGDGKTATIKERVYDGLETSSTVPVTDGSSGSQGQVNGQSVTLVQGEDGSYQITYLGRTYHAYYSDPGPAFIYRVRGKTYSGSGYTYEFSEDGKTMTCTSGTYENDTYTYAKQDANDRAVYHRNNRNWLQSGLPYWGLRLADNDQTLYWSPSSWATPETTPTNGVNKNPAYKVH